MSDIQLYDGTGREIQLTSEQWEFCHHLTRFNALRDFKLTSDDVIAWMREIVRLRANLRPPELAIAIDVLLDGRMPYDKSLGIRNIFMALKRVREREDGSFYWVEHLY